MIYCFRCTHCEHAFELSRPSRDAKKPALCERCGHKAERNFGAEHPKAFGDTEHAMYANKYFAQIGRRVRDKADMQREAKKRGWVQL